MPIRSESVADFKIENNGLNYTVPLIHSNLHELRLRIQPAEYLGHCNHAVDDFEDGLKITEMNHKQFICQSEEVEKKQKRDWYLERRYLSQIDEKKITSNVLETLLFDQDRQFKHDNRRIQLNHITLTDRLDLSSYLKNDVALETQREFVTALLSLQFSRCQFLQGVGLPDCLLAHCKNAIVARTQLENSSPELLRALLEEIKINIEKLQYQGRKKPKNNYFGAAASLNNLLLDINAFDTKLKQGYRYYHGCCVRGDSNDFSKLHFPEKTELPAFMGDKGFVLSLDKKSITPDIRHCAAIVNWPAEMHITVVSGNQTTTMTCSALYAALKTQYDELHDRGSWVPSWFRSNKFKKIEKTYPGNDQDGQKLFAALQHMQKQAYGFTHRLREFFGIVSRRTYQAFQKAVPALITKSSAPKLRRSSVVTGSHEELTSIFVSRAGELNEGALFSDSPVSVSPASESTQTPALLHERQSAVIVKSRASTPPDATVAPSNIMQCVEETQSESHPLQKYFNENGALNTSEVLRDRSEFEIKVKNTLGSDEQYSVTQLVVDKARTNEPKECTQKYMTEVSESATRYTANRVALYAQWLHQTIMIAKEKLLVCTESITSAALLNNNLNDAPSRTQHEDDMIAHYLLLKMFDKKIACEVDERLKEVIYPQYLRYVVYKKRHTDENNQRKYLRYNLIERLFVEANVLPDARSLQLLSDKRKQVNGGAALFALHASSDTNFYQFCQKEWARLPLETMRKQRFFSDAIIATMNSGDLTTSFSKPPRSSSRQSARHHSNHSHKTLTRLQLTAALISQGEFEAAKIELQCAKTLLHGEKHFEPDEIAMLEKPLVALLEDVATKNKRDAAYDRIVRFLQSDLQKIMRVEFPSMNVIAKLQHYRDYHDKSFATAALQAMVRTLHNETGQYAIPIDTLQTLSGQPLVWCDDAASKKACMDQLQGLRTDEDDVRRPVAQVLYDMINGAELVHDMRYKPAVLSKNQGSFLRDLTNAIFHFEDTANELEKYLSSAVLWRDHAVLSEVMQNGVLQTAGVESELGEDYRYKHACALQKTVTAAIYRIRVADTFNLAAVMNHELEAVALQLEGILYNLKEHHAVEECGYVWYGEFYLKMQSAQTHCLRIQKEWEVSLLPGQLQLRSSAQPELESGMPVSTLHACAA